MIVARFWCAVVLGSASFLAIDVPWAQAQSFESSDRLILGTAPNKSASIRLGDLDADGDLDVVVANGRHWPQQNVALLNQGRARFNVLRPLGADRLTTYACELADLDGDGDLDLATGNDMAPCHIFLNDGKANFALKSTFGGLSSVRSMTLADIDRDGDPDILLTCRGRSNQIFLNDGAANFRLATEFGTKTDSTIDVGVGDVDGDGDLDLVVANRDGQANAWLMNDGELNFDQVRPFGQPRNQSRAVTVGDFNGDGKLDWAVGNIEQPNQLFLGDGTGGVAREIQFGLADGRTYCLAAEDLDLDGDLDLVVGNAGQANAVFWNQGEGTAFEREIFDDQAHVTYGLSVGDLNGDRIPDIAVANTDELNQVFLGRPPAQTPDDPGSRQRAPQPSNSAESVERSKRPATDGESDWPSFRGLRRRGVAEGFSLPTSWNADPENGALQNVLWQVDVPGLGHSSPVVVGNRLFLLTAVAHAGEAPLQVQSGGRPTAADDNGMQDWLLLCYDKRDGQLIWSQTLHQGQPRATRHAKATHANTSVCVSNGNVVSFLGSEGLYCHDVNGKLLWQQDLGVVNISKYGIGWGFSSSPAVHQDRIVLVCDDPDGPYLSARSLADGREIWRTSRKEVCQRSWGTPLIHDSGETQVVVNGWPWIVSYRLSDGAEIWRIKGGGDNPIPSPFEANGLIYITNAHGGPSPIHAIRPSARGDLSLEGREASIAWSVDRGGSYMSTPVVYGDQIYFGNSNGVVRAFQAMTGESLFEGRLGSNAGVIASLVAGDGKIYCAAENGTVYVLEHGPTLKIVARNAMGEPCLATPAIAEGVIFIRTTKRLTAVKQTSNR